MADAALELLTDDERHRSFAEEARRQALARFEQKAVVAQYRELYQRVVNRR
jgi:glycosyltransferase involved in cell wall biosynthesis